MESRYPMAIYSATYLACGAGAFFLLAKELERMETTRSAATDDGCIISTKLHALPHFGRWDACDFHC